MCIVRMPGLSYSGAGAYEITAIPIQIICNDTFDSSFLRVVLDSLNTTPLQTAFVRRSIQG